MAYSVDWIARVITIPQGDLTLISGNNYSLDMLDVHIEVRRLESEFTEGLWAPDVLNHYPTVTLSGIPKSPTIEFTNSYTVQFGGSNYNVSLTGPDTNLLDVLIPGNGISVLANNSVGKQTVAGGSGASAQEVWDYPSASITDTASVGWVVKTLLILLRYIGFGK
jgi:hypothetical protein